MSENRDDATGQFSSGEELTGRAGLEHEAGYVPMPEENDAPEELTVKKAAEEKAAQGTSEANIVTHVAGIPANMTMTLDQASKALADARAADREQTEIDDADKIRAEVDKLRGEGAEDGADKSAAEAKPGTKAEAADNAEPDLEKVLNHPKVQEALSARNSEAEHARQQYSQGLETVRNFAASQFAAFFPEIANLPLPQWKGALAMMAQQQPARFQEAVQKIQHIEQLDAARQNYRQQQTQREQAEFQNYAKQQDARFADLVKGETPERMRAIEAEIPQMLSEMGVDPMAFLKAGNESKFLRSAAAQKILVDAARYRLVEKAAQGARTKAVPPVQRPGVAAPRVSAGARNLEGLRAQFNQAPNAKNAAAILAARRAANRG